MILSISVICSAISLTWEELMAKMLVVTALTFLLIVNACASESKIEQPAGETTGAAAQQAKPTPTKRPQPKNSGFLGGQQTCSRFGGILEDIASGKLGGGAVGGTTFIGETRWRIGQLGVDSLAAEPEIKKVSNALFRKTQQSFELSDLNEGFDELNEACTYHGYVTSTTLGPGMDGKGIKR